MEVYVERMCSEHKALSEKIAKLVTWINNPENNDPKPEFALKFAQAKAMISYEECLRNRLMLAGVTVSNGQYFEKPVDVKDEDTKQEETQSDEN